MRYLLSFLIISAILTSCDSGPHTSDKHKNQISELETMIKDVEDMRAKYDESKAQHDAAAKKHVDNLGDTHPVFIHFKNSHEKLFEDHAEKHKTHDEYVAKWKALEEVHMAGGTDETTMTYDHEVAKTEYSKILDDYNWLNQHSKTVLDEHAKIYMQLEKEKADGGPVEGAVYE